MSLDQFKDRNVMQNYVHIPVDKPPQKPLEKFKQVVRRTFKGELFVGLWVVFREMIKRDFHTVKYPLEKLPISPRYRAVHRLYRLLESGYERCIGCGLCVPTCEYDAMTLNETSRDDRYVPPRNTVATYLNLAKDRGLI